MQTAQQWLEEASYLLSQGKKSEAIACYDQVLADTLFHKGTTLYELGRFDEAHDCLDQCITLEKNYMPAYRGKFRVLQAEGRHECTIEWCDKAIEIDPYYRFAYNSKANALHDMKRYGEAVENYEKAISLDSNWSFPYNGMGNALTGLKKYDEAIEYYDKASELDPEDHFPLNGKAIALTLHRKYQEAKEVYDRLISLESEHPLYLCNRGRLLSALNKSQEAMNDFRKANEILKAGITDIELSPVHMEYIDKMLKPIMEIDGIHSNIKAILKNAKQDSPDVQKIVENVRRIEREQYQILSRMFIDTNDRLPEQEQVQTKSSLEEIKEKLVESQEELQKVIKIQSVKGMR